MVPTGMRGCSSMLSAIISTYELERSLVPTLAALVPGAATGLLAEVVIADANSRDATAEVADIAGCRFLASSEPLGARLKAAAATTRSPWLLFLRAGATPQSGWIEATDHFIRTSSAAGVTWTCGIPCGRCRGVPTPEACRDCCAVYCGPWNAKARTGSTNRPAVL